MTTAHVPLLDLHVPQDPGGAVTATMPLAWCFKPGSELAERVAARDFVRPHLLVVVRQKVSDALDREFDTFHYGDVEATLVPLTQGLQFLSFTRPGESQLLAFVIDVPTRTKMRIARAGLKAINNGAMADSSSFDHDGRLYDIHPRAIHDDVHQFLRLLAFLEPHPDVVHVVVPQEMFAPEPAAWRKRLVHRVFGSSRSVDQCRFRKKFWFVSLPLAPFMLAAATLLKLLYVAVLLPALAPRRLAWRKFLDPWCTPVGVVDESPDATSWFFQDPRSRSGYVKFTWRSLLSPLVLLGPSSLVYAVAHIPVHNAQGGGTHPWWWSGSPGYWLFVLQFDLVLVAVVALVVGAAAAAAWADERLLAGDPTRDARRRQRKAARRERDRQRLLHALEAMACGDAPPPLSVSDLPSDKKTVYLRYASVKSKVCKPFAR